MPFFFVPRRDLVSRAARQNKLKGSREIAWWVKKPAALLVCISNHFCPTTNSSRRTCFLQDQNMTGKSSAWNHSNRMHHLSSYRGVNTFSPEGRIFQVEYAIEAIKVCLAFKILVRFFVVVFLFVFLCEYQLIHLHGISPHHFVTAWVHCSWNTDLRWHPAGRGKKNHLYPDGALQRGKDSGNRLSRRCVLTPQ